MDFSALNRMVGWERKKAMFLIETAGEIGMDLDGYGEIAVNPNSGYTYLWSEDYPFTLFMPIDCELSKDDIFVLFTDYNTGEEEEFYFSDMPTIRKMYDALREWEKEREE